MINWLASYPKSGNTWARLLLGSYHHDAPCNINDTPSTGDVAEQYYQAATCRQLSSLTLPERAMIRPAALLNLIAMTRYRPLVVKTHFANAELFGCRMIPPELSGRAVYLVRDPRDIVPSFARHMGVDLDTMIANLRNDSYAIGHENSSHVLSSWSNHVKSWGSGSPETTLVKYEDMKADPCDALERMLVTFNVRPDEQRIERAVEACHLSRLKEREKSQGFNEQSKKAGEFFGATTEKLSESQRRQIENDHAEMMEEMGYCN